MDDARRRGSEVGFAARRTFARRSAGSGACSPSSRPTRGRLARESPFAFPLAAVFLAACSWSVETPMRPRLSSGGRIRRGHAGRSDGRPRARRPCPRRLPSSDRRRTRVVARLRPPRGGLGRCYSVDDELAGGGGGLLARLGEPERAAAWPARRCAAPTRSARRSRAGSPACRRAGGATPDLDGLAASVAVLRGSGARLELARSLVELGAALRRAGAGPTRAST